MKVATTRAVMVVLLLAMVSIAFPMVLRVGIISLLALYLLALRKEKPRATWRDCPFR